MVPHSATHYDKFQVAGILTAQAILGYFSSMHHLAVLNMAYSANQIIFDVTKHCVKKTGKPVPSLFQKTAPKSDDVVMQNMLPSANFIKHADRDWDKHHEIEPNDLLGYLNALCHDYRSLRDALIGHDFIRRHPESQKDIDGLNERSCVDLLVEIYPQYMLGLMFGGSTDDDLIPFRDVCPRAFSGATMQDNKNAVRDFLVENGFDFGLSGGLPDYYMTQVARPILDPLTDRSNPKPRAG
jgi:hypothetical protein